MAPTQPTHLSPAELSYLHTSLSLQPPIRPDARSPTTFRPLIAETDLLPGCNGSARLCFADGTEALVGIKADVEKTPQKASQGFEGFGSDVAMAGADETNEERRTGDGKWVEVTVDIPGQRDDDPLVVFLGAMIHEALVADGVLAARLWLNERWHWRIYIDVCPFPICSLSTILMRDNISISAVRCHAIAISSTPKQLSLTKTRSSFFHHPSHILFPYCLLQPTSPSSPVTCLPLSAPKMKTLSLTMTGTPHSPYTLQNPRNHQSPSS